MRLLIAATIMLFAGLDASAQFTFPNLNPVDGTVGPKGRIIDLKPFLDLEYNASYKGPAIRMPKAFEVDGLQFRIDGQMQVYGHTFSARKPTRGAVRQIPVNGPCEEMHVLQGTQWPDAEGVQLARIRLHYVGGGHHDFPFVYGRETRDWLYLPSYADETVSSPDTKVIWRDDPKYSSLKGHRRVWKTVLRNPHPQRRVKSFDIVSEYERGAFTVFAVTIANRDPKRPSTPPPPFKGPARNFDGKIKVSVVDASTGKPIAGAHLSTGGSVDGVGVVGEGYRTDARGEAVVLYRTAKTSSFSVNATKFGYGRDYESFRRGNFSDRIVMQLNPGQTVGGIVRDAEGVAMEGVRVSLIGNSGIGVTDETGRWQIGGVTSPDSIRAVTTKHFEYPEQQHGVGLAQRIQLKSKAFEATILPGPVITGRITDDFGRPIANAKITFGESFWDSNKQIVYSEGDGRFTIKNLPLGASKLVVQAPHRHPHSRPIQIAPSNADLEIQLAPGGVVKGIVIGADGKPIEDAQAEMIHTKLPSTYRIRMRTKDGGRFGIGAAPTGKTTWRISKQDYLTITKEIPADGTLTKVVLRRSVPLKAKPSPRKNGG